PSLVHIVATTTTASVFITTQLVPLIHSYSFFLYRYSNHQYLHSFPTRRSSDLRILVIILLHRSSDLRILVIILLLHFLSLMLGRDRKSGSAGMPRPISYAVFCLKKKKQTHPHFV